jgi:tetratricopeptide (TPR) repeat protein
MSCSGMAFPNRRWRGWMFAAWLAAAVCALAPAARAQGGYSAAGANRYLMAHQWDALLRYAQEWTRASPRDPEAWYYLGETYSIGFERPADSVVPLRRAVELKPVWAQAWNSLGLAHSKLKQYRDAAGAFQKAVEQSPQTMNYWFNLASAQSETGNSDGAHATLLRGAAVAGPSTGYADWFNLGLGFDQMHDCQNAANAFAQAVQRNPQLADGWNNLGACQAQLGRIDQARSSYRRAIALGNRIAAANLNQMEQQEKIRKEQERMSGGDDTMAQYFHRRSCSSGGSGTTGPCSALDMKPQ